MEHTEQEKIKSTKINSQIKSAWGVDVLNFNQAIEYGELSNEQLFEFLLDRTVNENQALVLTGFVLDWSSPEYFLWEKLLLKLTDLNYLNILIMIHTLILDPMHLSIEVFSI